MERTLTPGRGASALLIAVALCSAPSCREIVDYTDSPPPGSEASIVWERTSGLPGEAVLSLRVDQTGILYAGTEGGKLFRSVTDGNDWSPLPLPFADGAITAIIVDPLRRIFVANDIHGVWESLDGGSTWFAINSGLGDTAVYALAYLPSGGLIAGSARGHISATGNGSLDWTTMFSLARPVTSILVSSSGEIYAAAWGGGVYRFAEGDSTAAPVNSGLADLYVNVLHASLSGYLFAGTRTDGAYRSEPENLFWQSSGGGSIDREVIAFRTTQFGEIFAGTGAGIFYSTDAGLRWTKLDGGIGSREVRALSVNENATVFAGTADGVWRSVRVD